MSARYCAWKGVLGLAIGVLTQTQWLHAQSITVPPFTVTRTFGSCINFATSNPVVVTPNGGFLDISINLGSVALI
jgi:hypothetical protein